MISGPGSSFIPKQDRVSVPANMRRRRTFSVLSFVSSTALLASILLAGGAFFYKQQLLNKQEDLKVQLQSQREALNESDIFSVQNFDRKIQAARFLIENHVSPSKIFMALEQKTLERVQFAKFEFEHTPGFEAVLKLDGSTAEFSTLALQGRSFSENDLIETVIVKEVASAAEDSTETDDVIFNFEGLLDLAAFRYEASPIGQPLTNPVAIEPASVETGTAGEPVAGVQDFTQDESNVSN